MVWVRFFRVGPDANVATEPLELVVAELDDRGARWDDPTDPAIHLPSAEDDPVD
jgi:hypothetical protein